MADPLATVSDAASYGLTVTEAALRRASVRIRGHLGPAGSARLGALIAAGSVPDEIVELACTVAARLQAMPSALVGGVQSEGAGPFQTTYGWDSHKAASGLTEGEKQTLGKLLPRPGRTVSVGPSTK